MPRIILRRAALASGRPHGAASRAVVIRYVRRVPVTYAPEQAQLFEDGSDHLTVPVRLKGIRVERSRQFGYVYPCLNTCRGKQPSKMTASKARELLGILLDRLERLPERRHAPSERAPTGFTSAGDREAFNAVLADAERKGAIVVVTQAPVAQLDRAPDYESGGREFESLRARHFLI